ncbi:MAG: PilN domain-containing protein [Patescibacteria group bacterium]
MPQYNQSPLEQELRAEKLSLGLPWRILLLAIIVFGATVFIYFGMLLGYKPYLNSQLKKVDSEISILSEKVGEEQQNNLTEFYSQLTNIQRLFNSHILSSNVFGLLEENTNKGVFFASMNLSVKEKEVRLDGIASSYKILAEQLELFRLNPKIEQIYLKNSQLREGAVSFTINLILKSGVLSL